jgi:predicted PurR-regulated permease PerM
VLALVLTALLGPPLQFMTRKMRIPRVLASLFLILALFTVVWALGYAVAVPASG